MKDEAEIPKICSHENFSCCVDVTRLQDIAGYSADIRITCMECGTPFRFIGVPGGSSMREPMASPGGVELRCPIEPISAIVDEDLNAKLRIERTEDRP